MGSITIFAFSVILIIASTDSTSGEKFCTHPLRKDLSITFNKVTNGMKNVIVDRHNFYREVIRRGRLPGQPRGIDIKNVTWDDELAKSAQEVADDCLFKHKFSVDSRWKNSVGQNMYRTEQSVFDVNDVNWKRAVEMWFIEHTIYHYGRIKNDKDTMHYTQVIWADTKYVGCGYVAYENDAPIEKSFNDIAEIYVCHYGPPGNVYGYYPYRVPGYKYAEFGYEGYSY